MIQLPISSHWSTEEIIDVIEFFETVEKAHETKVSREELVSKYKRFKEIVPSKSEEKKLFRFYDRELGLSCYRIVKAALNEK